ncbi:MAG: stage II sporulation protein M [Candidatus Aenigmarchaeota archaeon]|nr:stage II sporulation protein M [Candidatus Aenigmarchaeota archaeon]
MIESFVNIKEIHKKPYYMFIWAVILGSISVFISNTISYQIEGPVSINLSGFFTILFIVFPSAYFITRLIHHEEVIEENYIEKHSKKSMWKRHEKYLLAFLFFFLGLTITFAFWSSVLPSDFFQMQVLKINQIQGKATDVNASFNSFGNIFMNNIQVMLFSFIFSFIFGAGAVFIIVWNASILGVYVGMISKSIWEIPLVSMSFLPHGIPEISAYLCAGLAGSLISVAIIRRNKMEVVKGVALDALKLFGLAILLIFIAAVIEVYL